mgnify:CR=1 FL=1
MTTKNPEKGLSEYVLKLRKLEKMKLALIKKEYDLAFIVISSVSEATGKSIKILSEFKHISCDDLQENFDDIKDIFISSTDALKDTFDIDIKFSKKDTHKKFLTFIRKILKQINYVLIMRNGYLSIRQSKL